MTRPNYRKVARFFKEKALSFHHSEFCSRECACQEYEQELLVRLQKELHRPLLDEEMDP
jgi:hypothetical protein